MTPARLGILVLVTALAACGSARPAGDHVRGHTMEGPRLPGGCEAPASANSGRMGCYFDGSVELGPLSRDQYWHVDEFPDLASATRARLPGRSIVVEAYGRTFLQTISDDAGWRSAGGRRLASVGPMAAPRGEPVTARFMQAMTRPGAATRPHVHDGAEAFYLLSGAICMETPDGTQTTSEGQTYLIAGGVPMQLTSAGAAFAAPSFWSCTALPSPG